MTGLTRLEACVDTLDAALAASRGGAARLELCADPHLQGTTPADDLLAACVAGAGIPVFAMIRPRAGAFIHTGQEIDVMLRQVARARQLGASGIVAGALRPDASIDADAVAALRFAAGPLPFTFHRAFDAVADQAAALEALMTLGVDRVLTSGRAATALEGAARIAGLVKQAGQRLVVVAGGSIRAHNVRDVVGRTGVREVHARLASEAQVRAVVRALG